MKIPTRKGYRPIAIDARDPDHIRVIQWEPISKAAPPEPAAPIGQRPARPSALAIERQASLFAD